MKHNTQDSTKIKKEMPNNNTKAKESPLMMKKEVLNKTPNDEGRSHQNRQHHDKSEKSNTGDKNHQHEQ
ncbi:16813_t:CDS:2 [Gigaspora margarita]|uniref:16813_t:CDS:1 n=1 Tax=Gigaspora margarita TaxID=4874 RepID=A0ABN7VKD6_GIGMA|nr:16813_t:CDS:2 [Gigaspora margarita]